MAPHGPDPVPTVPGALGLAKQPAAAGEGSAEVSWREAGPTTIIQLPE